MPYLGFNQDKFNKNVKSDIEKLYAMVSVYFVPLNPLNIGSLFKFKGQVVPWHNLHSCLFI